MSKPEAAAQTQPEAEVETKLTPAQIQALDGDGNGEAGGSLPRRAGEVVKKGKAGPTAEDLGTNPRALVRCRVTEKGDGQIHDGQGGRYDRDDEIVLPLSVAADLRGKPGDRNALGYVEILGKA